MKSLKDVREFQYQYHYKHESCQFLKNWKKYPYSCLRAVMWMEMSSLLVYFLQKTKITPNALSVAYALFGLFGGILLAIPAKAAILTAVFIFFFKAIFDWCDGPLARITNRISSTGDILDCYGAILGAMGLEIGLGFYVAHKSGWLGWYYLIPLIPLFFFGKLHSFAFYIIYRNHITPRNIEEHLARRATDNVVGSGEGSKKSVLNERLEKVRQFANNFLDHRSRTIDFICLLLLIETFTSIFVTWIIFLGFVVKEFLLFTASFYVVVKRGWVERELNNKLEELSGAFIAEKRSENQEVPAPKE